MGVELITNPRLIYLDEPTSGLDSYGAFKVVQILRELSLSGCTVVATIHQPSSEVFSLFHEVQLLASGRTVYDGSVEGLTKHFTSIGYPTPPNTNPADHMMFVVQTVGASKVKEIQDSWGLTKNTQNDRKRKRWLCRSVNTRVTAVAFGLSQPSREDEAQRTVRDKGALIAGFRAHRS